MSGKTGTNHPGGRQPTVKARQLQCRLWVAAKRSPDRRFHAPMDRVWRADLLWTAGSVSGVRVMRRPERPLGSRVREIRMHGLNGGPTCNHAVLRGTASGRIYHVATHSSCP